MRIETSVIDNSDEVIRVMREAALAGLDAVGAAAASHADANVVEAGRVDTGNLHNSITHRVMAGEKAVYVGTNNEYAVYHELGTGTFAEGGKGRKGWWVYVPGHKVSFAHKLIRAITGSSGKVYSREEAARIVARMRAQGIDAHMTQGIKPIHFLKKAASEHTDEYKEIIEQHLKK